MKIECLGDAAVLVVVGEVADEVTAERVRGLAETMRGKCMGGVRDVVPSYRTVGVHYDPAVIGMGAQEKVRAWVEECAKVGGTKGRGERKETVIPVCYGGEFGPDLSEVAALKGMSEEEVIGVHSGGTYVVRAVGFVPGFAYLAGLAERLASPRRATPRARVAAGSVGIAGMQTGVYPLEVPGGWQLIGRTPVRMFRPEETRVSVLEMGDGVRFRAITAEEFRAYEEGGR